MSLKTALSFAEAANKAFESDVPEIVENLVRKFVGEDIDIVDIRRIFESCVSLVSKDNVEVANLVIEQGHLLITSLFSIACDTAIFLKRSPCCTCRCSRTRKQLEKLDEELRRRFTMSDGKNAVLYMLAESANFLERHVHGASGKEKRYMAMSAVRRRIGDKEDMILFLDTVGSKYLDSYVRLGKARFS